jgi:hypothetical protein
MSRSLIGSSNIYRFYKLITSQEFKPYKLVCCTNQDVWNVAVDDITITKGGVVISVIKNLICDAIVDVTDQEVRRMTIEDVVGWSFMAQKKRLHRLNPV